MSIVFPFEVTAQFEKLSNQLNKAYGFGFRPDRDKITKIVDAALELTSENPTVSEEECEFYRSASAKVSPSEESLDQLKETIDAITSVIDLSEITAKEVRAAFLAKTNLQRTEYLASETYHSLVRKANEDTAAINETAKKIQELLFKPEKRANTNPFKNLSTFAEHRKAVSELYNEVVGLGNRHARVVASLSPESLYESEPASGWISSHPYISSLAGVALAAATGYFGWKYFG